jgi:hypothetical protein
MQQPTLSSGNPRKVHPDIRIIPEGFVFAFLSANRKIGQGFAKVKARLRQVAARTVEGLWQAVAEALDAFSREECANYFRNAGYGVD